MHSQLFIASLAGLGGMLGWGLADFFGKKTIDAIGDTISLAWGHIFGTIVLIILVLYKVLTQGASSVSIPHDPKTWLILALFGVVQAAVYLLVYRGFGKGQLSILNPIFASFSGITALLSIVVFGEIVNGYLITGLVTLFIGILLMSIDIPALRTKRLSFLHIPGFKEIACATILAALWTLFWDRFVGGQDWLSYALFMYAFMTIAILVFAKFKKISLSVKKPEVWKFLIFIGLFETLAYVAISMGYSKTSLTSVVALLSGAFSLPTIVLARLFLKEKVTRTQTIGSLIVVAGIMLLSLI